MLNENTRATLGQLAQINKSMIISYPITAVIMGKSIQAFLKLEEMGETEFEQIGVYSIGEFNSIIKLIDEPEITNNNGTLLIKGKNTSVQYGTTSIDILDSNCTTDFTLLDRIKTNTLVGNFSITKPSLDKVQEYSNILKDLSNLDIMSNGENIDLIVQNSNKSSNKYSVIVGGVVNEEFKMTIDMDMINKLPKSDYEISIYKSKSDNLVSVFKSINVPALEIVLSAKAASGI